MGCRDRAGPARRVRSIWPSTRPRTCRSSCRTASTLIGAPGPGRRARRALRSGVARRRSPAGARVGTSSLRRTAQLRALRPDLDVCALHGNVDTRLRRLAAGDFEAIVLAMAGLDRLGPRRRRAARRARPGPRAGHARARGAGRGRGGARRRSPGCATPRPRRRWGRAGARRRARRRLPHAAGRPRAGAPAAGCRCGRSSACPTGRSGSATSWSGADPVGARARRCRARLLRPAPGRCSPMAAAGSASSAPGRATRAC